MLDLACMFFASGTLFHPKPDVLRIPKPYHLGAPRLGTPQLFRIHAATSIIQLLANDGGDRLRQEPERSSRCMPGYLMQLVKKRRETQLPTLNWLSLPN